mmetsp:Transcript_10487/g.32043  ORF Transcript_10487/g.32043 Transcript_10487/m.32043 type:complete len:507 (+) Transcript_10487:310-1830(+)|eukprot:CAMPEP_0198729328 /NCGR_PEP_ID=MMETSP1475-20131203/17084_1 /TAXON_ID= ORGANISM="Unidentified sp., Strain CCMP1999" /NCGR_SAMPLE_ID=MMETSP1475 /ASSEMBLY_ACC=CAM_ASM_001111 /LENGTH=506 /DNA_ID=CAMNT_0044491939 /DNA_START=303 /DNA_END=1823 /DNA_ORIENTATION=-
MGATELRYITDVKPALSAQNVVLIGTKNALQSSTTNSTLLKGVSPDLLSTLIQQANTGSNGTKVPLQYLEDGTVKNVSLVLLPPMQNISRHNHPLSPHAVTALVSSIPWVGDQLGIVVVLEKKEHAYGIGCAIARAFPLYNRKSGNSAYAQRTVQIALVHVKEGSGPLAFMAKTISTTAENIRTAQRLVDMPSSELTVDSYVKECKTIADELGVEIEVFRMRELEERGMGCIAGVGRAAISYSGEPAMVILKHRSKGKPGEEQPKTISLVGKGIVFDTGGLALKSRDGMCEMKMDMGGSAAVLLAFKSAVQLSYPGNLNAVLCIAENGIGPTALKPDDIVTSYSGKTVEINNPDAEGRLVLADGVAYAATDLKSDVIIDMATLTGAQMIATGQRHAAIITNNLDTEYTLFRSGLASGDLTWPLPYCPEFFRSEFSSRVADMKNSVKNRANAQSSCAAQFIADHLPSTYSGVWAHIDMAGTAMSNGRATGYGVALIVQYLGLLKLTE